MPNLFRNPQLLNPSQPDPAVPITLAADWRLTWLDRVEPVDGQDVTFKRPTAATADGAVSVALEYGAFWCALTQDFTNLIPQAVYKISWTVAQHMEHSGPLDVVSTEARIKTSGMAGPWENGAKLLLGVPVVIAATFTASAPSDAIGIELRARHGLQRNRFVLSSPLLELVSSPSAPPSSGGAPIDHFAVLTTLVTALDVRIQIVEAMLAGLRADRDAILTEIMRLRNEAND